MHFPDAGRPVFISRDAKLKAHEKRGTGGKEMTNSPDIAKAASW
jgi:hypothetical protein